MSIVIFLAAGTKLFPASPRLRLILILQPSTCSSSFYLSSHFARAHFLVVVSVIRAQKNLTER